MEEQQPQYDRDGLPADPYDDPDYGLRVAATLSRRFGWFTIEDYHAMSAVRYQELLSIVQHEYVAESVERYQRHVEDEAAKLRRSPAG